MREKHFWTLAVLALVLAYGVIVPWAANTTTYWTIVEAHKQAIVIERRVSEGIYRSHTERIELPSTEISKLWPSN